MKDQFRAFIKANEGILYKVGRSFTDNQADFDDLYQEFLIQIWKSMDRFEGKSKASTFIYRIALNTALTFQKQRERHQVRIFDAVKTFLADRTTREDQENLSKKVKLLYQCIYQLKDGQKAIILLYLEEKSYQEIAEITGITINLVGVKINRAKKKLQELLVEYGYGRL